MRACVTLIEKNGLPANRAILADDSSDVATLLTNAAAAGYAANEVVVREMTKEEYFLLCRGQPPTVEEQLSALRREITDIEHANQFTHRFWRDYFKLMVAERPELASHPVYARILEDRKSVV